MASCGCGATVLGTTGCTCRVDGSSAIEVTGSGSTGQPFIVSMLLDPDPSNVAQVNTDGLFVPASSGGGGGGSPSGAAGGDLSGTYPNPQIAAGVITSADVNASYKDGAANVASMRTIGGGALQAAPGTLALDTKGQLPVATLFGGVIVRGNLPPPSASNLVLTSDLAVTNPYNMKWATPASTGGGGGSSLVEVIWSPGDGAKLGTPFIFSKDPADTITYPGTAWSKNVTQVAASGTTGAVGPYRMRIKSPISTTGGNTRLALPVVGADSADSEMRSIWLGHSGLGEGQMGHMHRVCINPANGRPWGYIAFMNISFSLDSLITVSAWTTDGANPPTLVQASGAGTGFVDMPGLQNEQPITGITRFGTTITASTTPGHGNGVGNHIELAGFIGPGAALNGEIGNITAVTEDTFTMTSGSSGTISPGGTGHFLNYSRIMPYWVASRLVDTTLKVKCWRMDTAEPDWANTSYALSMTPTTNIGPPAGTIGSQCLYAGHLHNDTEYVDFGSVTVRNLD